jgi:hypothetical protein
MLGFKGSNQIEKKFGDFKIVCHFPNPWVHRKALKAHNFSKKNFKQKASPFSCIMI